MKYRIVTLAAFLPLALAACSAEGETSSAPDSSTATSSEDRVVNADKISSDRTAGPAIEVNLDGTLKSGETLTVSTPCTEKDTSALAVASFGEHAYLEKENSEGPLTGTITVPEEIEQAPDDDPHTITVTCENGANSMIPIPNAES